MKEIEKINSITNGSKNVVFVFGNFNILHPGHLRLLKFAKENGDFLVVGVMKEDENTSLLDPQLRLESVMHSKYVDYAFVLDHKPEVFIEAFKPAVVVKGVEHENKYNPELTVIESYGGKLIFSSGDIGFSSLSLLQDEFNEHEFSTIKQPKEYLNRHQISRDEVLSILEKFKDLDVLVIGDTIVDEYKTCEPLGMSQEDPTIVVSPISTDTFLGGAGIVAAHAAGLGAKVDFFTVLGNDEYAKFVNDKLDEFNVKGNIYKDASRPTTLKQRFRANRKTLLRVNHLKNHSISLKIQEKIIKDIEKIIENKDLILFSDFSYGCLPQNLIDKIIALGLKHNIMMSADSQSSSQTGDITKFNHMNLITPTERESRLGIKDFESGLIILAEKLSKNAMIKNIFVTLGAEGILIHANADDKENTFTTDQIPALNSNPKDVAGAGDSLLIASSMAMASEGSIMQSAYVGSLAAAIQVGRVGNIPLRLSELKEEIIK